MHRILSFLLRNSPALVLFVFTGSNSTCWPRELLVAMFMRPTGKRHNLFVARLCSPCPSAVVVCLHQSNDLLLTSSASFTLRQWIVNSSNNNKFIIIRDLDAGDDAAALRTGQSQLNL